jgi:glutathione peroxidase-family protein
VFHEARQCRGSKLLGADLGSNTMEQTARKRWNVAFPRSKRRHANHEGRDPMIQILPELTAGEVDYVIGKVLEWNRSVV